MREGYGALLLGVVLRSIRLGLAGLLLGSLLCSCISAPDELTPANPVTVSMWHYYFGPMKDIADQLIAEFNITVGRERGIVVNVTAIMEPLKQEDVLIAIANDNPGMPELPDLTSAYPISALLLQQAGLLVPLDELLTSDELASYVPQFLDEGIMPVLLKMW